MPRALVMFINSRSSKEMDSEDCKGIVSKDEDGRIGDADGVFSACSVEELLATEEVSNLLKEALA